MAGVTVRRLGSLGLVLVWRVRSYSEAIQSKSEERVLFVEKAQKPRMECR